MNKIAIVAVAFAAFALASCGGKTETTSNLDSAAVGTVVADTAGGAGTESAMAFTSELTESVKSGNVEQIKASLAKGQVIVQEYIAKGDTAQARLYAAKVKEFVQQNQEKLKEMAKGNEQVMNLVNAAAAMPDQMLDVVNKGAEMLKKMPEGAKAAAAAAASKAAGDAMNAANAAATDAADKAVKDVVNAAGSAADAAKTAAKTAVQEKANEAANKVQGNVNKAAEKVNGAVTRSKEQLKF